MANTALSGLFGFFLGASSVDTAQEAPPTAGQELYELKRELVAAYSRFNNTPDPALLEAVIYEIKSLEARYSHALRRLKEGG